MLGALDAAAHGLRRRLFGHVAVGSAGVAAPVPESASESVGRDAPNLPQLAKRHESQVGEGLLPIRPGSGQCRERRDVDQGRGPRAEPRPPHRTGAVDAAGGPSTVLPDGTARRPQGRSPPIGHRGPRRTAPRSGSRSAGLPMNSGTSCHGSEGKCRGSRPAAPGPGSVPRAGLGFWQRPRSVAWSSTRASRVFTHRAVSDLARQRGSGPFTMPPRRMSSKELRPFGKANCTRRASRRVSWLGAQVAAAFPRTRRSTCAKEARSRRFSSRGFVPARQGHRKAPALPRASAGGTPDSDPRPASIRQGAPDAVARPLTVPRNIRGLLPRPKTCRSIPSASRCRPSASRPFTTRSVSSPMPACLPDFQTESVL